MTEILIFYAVLLLIIVFTGYKGTIIVQKDERIAVIRDKQFIELIGPGPKYKIYWNLDYWLKLKIGEAGVYLGSNIAKFGNFEITGEILGVVEKRDNVAIKSFQNNMILIEKNKK